jgi:hypothetical protein
MQLVCYANMYSAVYDHVFQQRLNASVTSASSIINLHIRVMWLMECLMCCDDTALY